MTANETTILWFILASVLVTELPAHAGGLYLYELGSPDVGLATAGYAARA